MAAILTQEDRPQEALMVYRQLVARRPHDQALADRVRELSGSMGASTPGPAAEG